MTPTGTAPDIAAPLQAGTEAAAAGRWDESLARYEEALRLARLAGEARDVAEILRRIGMVHRDRRHLEPALELFEASCEIARLNGLDVVLGRALLSRATVDQLRGDQEAAVARYEEAREIAGRIGDEHMASLVEQNLGTLSLIRGDIQGALASFRSVLAFSEKIGDLQQASRVLNNMAMALTQQGKWEEAESTFARAIETAKRMEHQVMVAAIEVNRAELEIRRGAFDAARDACTRAFEMHERLGSEVGCAEVHKLMGIVSREDGDLDAAHRHFVTSVELARRCEDPLLEAQVLRDWARVYLLQRRNADALRRLNEAHRLFAGLAARRDLLELDRDLDELEAAYLLVVRAWGESVESKDDYTAGHCDRVGEYACMLAGAAGMEGRDLAWFRMAGYLHDVGKASISPALLNKRGPLLPEEWDQMKRHTIEGDALVAEIDFPWQMCAGVRSHHEGGDGTGYPDGLAGEAIPWTARILCIADVYDALTTTRSYRRALTGEEALQVMRADAGKHFDPTLFPLFEDLITRRASGAA